MLDEQNSGNFKAVLVSRRAWVESDCSSDERLTRYRWRSQHGRNAAAASIRPELDSAIEQLLPAKKLTKAPAAATAARRRPVVAKRDWAHVVDVNREIANFHELVPDMAREVSRA